MNAIVHGPAENEAEGAGLNFAVFGNDSPIDEINPGCVIGNCAGILQDPVLPIGKHFVVADKSRVARVDPLVGVRGYAAVQLRKDERVAAGDGDERRADRYFDSDDSPPPSPKF